MQMYRWTLPRDKLDAMPEEERTLFLSLGHFLNQAAILGKWINWCSAADGASEVERRGASAQSMLVLSLFAAKLNEGWELLQKQYFASKLSKDYTGALEKGALDSLEKLKRYFSSDNILKTCRNEYAFHYAPDLLKEHYPNLPKDEETDIYLCEQNGLSLYHVCEMAAARSVLATLGKGDPGAGMNNLITESLKISFLFQSFVAGFMMVFLKRLGVPNHTEVAIGKPPKFEDVKIPFLAEMD
jgi:hypothetical protein